MSPSPTSPGRGRPAGGDGSPSSGPGSGALESLQVTGPESDARLLAGWLRSRLRRQVELAHRPAKTLRRVDVDGEAVEPPSGPAPTPSDLLSEQLDVFGRDPIYEAAVSAAR